MELYELLRSVEIVDTASARNAAAAAHVSHVGHATSGHTTRHTAGHATGSASSSLVDSHYDGLELAFDFLLLSFVFFGASFRVGLEPLESVLGQILDGLLIILGEFVLQLLVLELVL